MMSFLNFNDTSSSEGRESGSRARTLNVRRLFLLTAAAFFTVLAPLRAADPPSDSELIEKQRGMEKDLEARVQSILDKIFGPQQSEVKAIVNLSILKQVEERKGAGEQSQKKSDNPMAQTKFILPGVPAPKNVGKEKEPENVQKQESQQQKTQTQVSFRINVTRREVVVFYNELMKSKEPEARKAVMAMTDLQESELKFVIGKFYDRWSALQENFFKDPRNLIYSGLLVLILLLLFWLFVPLLVFFRNYIRALKEKAGIEVKMESNAEETGTDEGQMGGEGLEGEEGETEEGKEGDEEMQKKYMPFDYINEENTKRLLGVFRKEPPQVIALVLSYLKPELVKAIYSELPVELQTRVAAESAAVRQTSEEQVRMIDADIKAKIDFLVGGVDNLIQLLEEVNYKIRDNILEYLKDHKPQIYQKVRGSILLFEDSVTFPDMAMQVIIRELKTDQLARALRNASPEIMNKFLTNMSQGGAALLKEEMEFGRPVTDEQVEQERQEIVERIKQLEAEGKVQVREKKKVSIFESEDATSPLMPSLREQPGSEARAGANQGSQGQFAQQQSAPVAAAGGDISSYLSYGQQLYAEQKFDEAAPYFQYVVEADPQNAEAYQGLGHCYYGMGMVQEALQCYEYALQLSPEDEALKQWVEQFKQSSNI